MARGGHGPEHEVIFSGQIHVPGKMGLSGLHRTLNKHGVSVGRVSIGFIGLYHFPTGLFRLEARPCRARLERSYVAAAPKAAECPWSLGGAPVEPPELTASRLAFKNFGAIRAGRSGPTVWHLALCNHYGMDAFAQHQKVWPMKTARSRALTASEAGDCRRD